MNKILTMDHRFLMIYDIATSPRRRRRSGIVFSSIYFRVGRGSGPSMRRVGSQNSPSKVGWVGSGPVSKMSNKYTIYTQETDYSTTIIHNDNKL